MECFVEFIQSLNEDVQKKKGHFVYVEGDQNDD